MSIWYSLSSQYDMMFWVFGTIASWATVAVCIKLDLLKESANIKYLGFGIVFSYYLWIVKEVFKAGIDVSRRVWSPNGLAYSGFCDISLPKTNNIGMVAFANSVTLTPGTISVFLHGNKLVVHTLDTSLEESLRRDSAKMLARVNKMINFDDKHDKI